jgi:CheY-like chemotaxis protein
MENKRRKKRILILDNDECIVATFKKVLERAGFDTGITSRGHEALGFLGSRKFDVLLVDDDLPDLHLGDFLHRLGRLPIQPGIIVMQASMPTPMELRHYISLGAFAVVPKHHLAEVYKAVQACCADEPLAKTC